MHEPRMTPSSCLSMISAQTRSAFVARENRYPLFRIMLLMRQYDRHLNLAARSHHLERYFIAVTANSQVDAGRPEPQIAQQHFVEEVRQVRIAQTDLAARGIEFETEGCFQ